MIVLESYQREKVSTNQLTQNTRSHPHPQRKYEAPHRQVNVRLVKKRARGPHIYMVEVKWPDNSSRRSATTKATPAPSLLHLPFACDLNFC